MMSLMDIGSARRRGGNTRRLVFEYLRQQIISLELPPGTPISEADVAARLDVSRTPVRESLILLAEEGLVEVYPQRGTFVGPIVYADVVTAQFVREALECASIQGAVGHLGPRDLADLRANISRQRRADDGGDLDEFFRLDEAFHQQLMAAGGHASAWPIVSRAKAHLDRTRRLSLPAPGKLDALIDQHEKVLDAAAAGDAPTAVATLRAHLQLVLDDITAIQRERPDLFSRAPERTT